jgi:hypothetical protein
MEAPIMLHRWVLIILIRLYLISVLITELIRIAFLRQSCLITLPWVMVSRREHQGLAMQGQNIVFLGHLLLLLVHHHK